MLPQGGRSQRPQNEFFVLRAAEVKALGLETAGSAQKDRGEDTAIGLFSDQDMEPPASSSQIGIPPERPAEFRRGELRAFDRAA